jgi:sialic acid synthase SpsE
MAYIQLKNRRIGDGYPCYIIAEMSANHGGKLPRALEIVRAAKAAGADCIKTQTYTADTITMDSDSDCFLLKEGLWKGETLYSLYKKAYTPWEWQAEIKAEAERQGIDFLSTPFDATAVDFLEGLGVEFYKISSFELVDAPLLKRVAGTGKPIILSTGMATEDEIARAVSVVRQRGPAGGGPGAGADSGAGATGEGIGAGAGENRIEASNGDCGAGAGAGGNEAPNMARAPGVAGRGANADGDKDIGTGMGINMGGNAGATGEGIGAGAGGSRNEASNSGCGAGASGDERCNLVLLKCCSAYPAPIDGMNLRAIPYLRSVFRAPAGLSDHTMTPMAACTAVALGASVIEKHFCMSRQIPTPDAGFSTEPDEFRDMAARIREIERALGKAGLGLSAGETANRLNRKSIFVTRPVREGDMFTPQNTRVIRPGNGLDPKYYESVLGRRAACDIKPGTPLGAPHVLGGLKPCGGV